MANDTIRLNSGHSEKTHVGQAIKIPKGKESQKGETFHTIQAGETLYKLTTICDISAKVIREADSGLNAESFRIDRVVLIPLEQEQETRATQTPTEEPAIRGPIQPRYKDTYKVEHKRTVLSVSREYGINEQELIAVDPELEKRMKKRQYLCIPYPNATTMQPTALRKNPYATPPSNNELFHKNKETP